MQVLILIGYLYLSGGWLGENILRNIRYKDMCLEEVGVVGGVLCDFLVLWPNSQWTLVIITMKD